MSSDQTPRPVPGEVWVRRRDKRDGPGPRTRVGVVSVSRTGWRGSPTVEWRAIDPRRWQRRHGVTEMSMWLSNYEKEEVQGDEQ